MKIIAVDDEISALNILTRAILEAAPGCQLKSFSKASEAVMAACSEGFCPDVAFLDIELPGTTGFELAARIKQVNPNVNIIFVTGFSSHALEAWTIRPSGYMMKPATKEKVREELANLRYLPIKDTEQAAVRVRCFGDFEVYVNDEQVQFTRNKSKEMLAYIIDRHGARCSPAELGAVLWGDGLYDRSRQKQLSVIRLEMISALKQAGAEHIIIKSQGFIAADVNAFDCDYYKALSGDIDALNMYFGEYMSPFPWAKMRALGSDMGE